MDIGYCHVDIRIQTSLHGATSRATVISSTFTCAISMYPQFTCAYFMWCAILSVHVIYYSFAPIKMDKKSIYAYKFVYELDDTKIFRRIQSTTDFIQFQETLII